MKVKQIIFVVLIAAMLLSIVGCSSNTTETEDTSAKETISIDFSNLETGSTITLGKYDDLSINWIILNKQYDKVFLTTENPVEKKEFHSDNSNVTWENSTIRRWLNDDFYNTAFSDAEKELIMETQNTSITNYGYSREEETTTTTEKVFLLDQDEIVTYRDTMNRDETPILWTRDTTYTHTVVDVWFDGEGHTWFNEYGIEPTETRDVYPAIWVEIKE